MELVIRNGMVIDGSRGTRFSADVAIDQGRITGIGHVGEFGQREIDARGAIVAPGFIDVHTHFDAQVFWDRMLSPSVYHGVTTVLSGNCGFTLAPLSGRPEDTDYLLRMLSRVEGMPLATLRESVKPDWTSFGEYLDRIDGTLAINTAFLVGHSALRRAVMGDRAVTDPATADEIQSMSDLLRRSIAEGGVGFSTTVSMTHSDFEGRPVPSRVASRQELLSLAAVAGEYPGTWIEMVFGVPFMQEEQYALAADLSKAANRPLNWNAIQINTDLKEPVRDKLHAGNYASERGATVIALVPAAPLISLLNFVNCFVLDTLPGWSRLVGMSLTERVKSLADSEFRTQLKNGAERARIDGSSLINHWSDLVLEGLTLPGNRRWNGRRLGDCAAGTGKEPLDALFDLAVEENLGVSFSYASESTDERSWAIRRDLWRDPRCLIGGSDAGAHLDMLNAFAFSTQLLGEGVRRRRLLPLEEAVYRITGLPAARFGLTGRGQIALGAAADVVIFDPDTVDCGPIAMRQDLPGAQKRLYADSVGIRHVIVGGRIVASDNRPTGQMGGRVLRSGRDTHTVPIGPEKS
jgi:N-acyl-D-aspartate/D-glutamate deacylase